MLELTLTEQIFVFIRDLRTVEERQIFRFFRKETEAAISAVLQDLKFKQRIHEVAPNTYSIARKLPMSISQYTDSIRAVDVMCELTSQDVTWFGLGEYPTELVFIDKEQTLYDVVVFSSYNLGPKASLLSQYRKSHLPDYLEDPYNHIAVVPDEDTFRKIEYLGWNMFATIQKNSVFMYELEN